MIDTDFRQLGGPSIGTAMEKPQPIPDFMREEKLEWLRDEAEAAQLLRTISGDGGGGRRDEPQQPQGPPPAMGINARYGDSANKGGATKLGFNATAGSPTFYKPQRKGPVMGYAKGGDVKAGQTILVGEEGPEIMRVKKDAEIIPNHRVSKFYQSRAKRKKC